MRRVALLVFAASVLVANRVGAVKLGGGITGAAPPNKDSAQCEGKVAKAGARTIVKLTGCHVKAAKAVAKGKTFDEESCEQSILGAFGATTSGPGCPSCLSNLKGSVVEQFVDQTAFVKFCGGTAALGDSDDNGTVPADAKAVKCETKVAIASGIHAAAITNCNAALAKQLFKGKTFDTARCEAKATSRLMATKTTDCPSCIRLEAIDSFQKFLLHANAGLVFCASPSGAFIDGAFD